MKTLKGPEVEETLNIFMIYLYKKTHNKTGLQYLGQTTSKDPYKYQGSGTKWQEHIKEHGYDVTTEILQECETKKDLKTWGAHYSEKWNVAKSVEWANQVPESGNGYQVGPRLNKPRSAISKNSSRPFCRDCGLRPCGVNYVKHGNTYYRSRCDSCIREANAIKPAKPNWTKSGYKKKMECDKCHFKARWGKQIIVYYADGDLKNTRLSNLKSICLNCSVAVEKQDMPWIKDLGLTPDN